MFTKTNINSLPVSAIQIMNTSNNHPPLSTNPSWHLTTPTPSVVSIINGNSPTYYIATQSSSSSLPTTTNIIRQSPQTVHLVSPSFTIINNSNTTITGQVPIISTSNNIQSGICLGTSLLGRLATQTIQRQSSENLEEKVE
jgi:hypothetical protein